MSLLIGRVGHCGSVWQEVSWPHDPSGCRRWRAVSPRIGRRVAPPIRNTPHTTQMSAAAAQSMALSTAAQGQGSTVLSPRPASRARGRASSMYSSRRPPRRLFSRPASPVRNPAADPRPFINATCTFLVAGFNCPSACRAVTASPDFKSNCFDVEIRGPRAVGPTRSPTSPAPS